MSRKLGVKKAKPSTPNKAPKATVSSGKAKEGGNAKPVETRSQLAKKARNRKTIGGTAKVNKKLKQRAYDVLDGKRPNGGLKTEKYSNDGRGGSTVLPSRTASGKKITYTSTRLRPGAHKGRYSNARVVEGSDGSAWVSRHYGQNGGRVVQIQ